MVELYLFSGGTITLYKSELLEGAPERLQVTVPVPFFLYRRGREAYLVDSGLGPGAHLTPPPGWRVRPSAVDCVSSLRDLGLAPRDLEGVVLTHVHIEHAGGLAHLGDIPVIVQERELGFLQESHQGPVAALSGETEIAPGLTVIPTSGHTAGHQSVLVVLEEAGPLFLCGDAAELQENALALTPSGRTWSRQAAVSSLLALRSVLEETGAYPIYGHDPIQWTDLNHGPRDPYR